ncbi:hypothetical protein ABPG77_008607 [Micractinium sp. CCAP 211/92]
MQSARLQPQCATARASARALPPRPPRCLVRPVQASQQDNRRQHLPTDHQEQQQQDSSALLAFKAMVLISAANAVAASWPAAAQAASGSGGGWHPRRHVLSKLRQRHSTEETPKQAAARRAAQRQQAAAAATASAAPAQPAAASIQQLVQAAQERVVRLWRGEEVYSVGIKANRQQTYSTGASPTASPYGWVALAAAGAALAALLFGGRLRWGGGRRGNGGRWVRDRSLGGRMIFIPDAEPAGQAKPMRSLYDELGGGDEEGIASGAPSSGSGEGPWATSFAAQQQQQQQGRREPELPSWWKSPNFLVYTPFSRKDELQRQARIVLRQLEDAKLLQGLDYPISALVTLRTLCQEAGGYQVKPRTESGRDAMLRTGVRAALAAAQEGSFSLLGGDQPNKFVCGLAHDLGVPDAKVVTIVHAEVAALCRGALIDAEAAYRAIKQGEAERQGDLLLALVRIAGALQAFPLPPGSAEAEMVAAGVVKQTTLEFRKSIFLEFGAVSFDLAALVAEMLGFNPELVMPFLREQQQQEVELQQQAGEEGRV